MIYVNYTKNDSTNVDVAKALFLELNQIMPDQIFMDLSSDSDFWQLLLNSNNNVFIFLNSKHFYNDIRCWQRLDQAWKFKEEGKIKKIIEIKLDDIKSPNFVLKDLIWIKYSNNLSQIIRMIISGINYNDWKNFEKQTNFIYVKMYYKNLLDNNEAILVNENQDWDVVIVKIKSIHDNIDKWSYSIMADKIWIDDFYSTRPKIAKNNNDGKPSELWLKRKDLFFKMVRVGQFHELNCNSWQSFIFFKDFFTAYEMTNISLTIQDLSQYINYTIQVI